MAIQIAATRQNLADAYKAKGAYFGLCTGNPGTTTTPANEVTGTGPEGAYTRVQATTTSGSSGTVTYGNVSINAPATGSTYTVTHACICTAASGATQFDWAPLASSQQVGPLGGVITLTGASFTQT
ncbi:hypothetical protein FK530_19195 [Tsukamurella conjunctivitidis]|uniref:Uncharacterized protein n=1 Tax=Tsukamurella conjunctivitidis TaxID=2592068 RepID=A0A5C5RWZ7_9ACTN|nr:hypothetical protein [Tsukamurella conjunctivitidis]TWS27274.1 hypothetical protein FK530_19195 [Tsukamurella conjunctivitidis]